MKTGFKTRLKMWAIIAAGFLMVVSLVSVAAPRESADREIITLSLQEATRIAKTLDQVMLRAVRPDAPELGDAEFPPGSMWVAEDLEALRECCCLLHQKLDDCCEVIRDNCSIIELIEERIGDPCDDASIDFCNCTNSDTIDNSKASVMAYLKTILRELRGLVGEADYCQSCPSVE